MADKPTMPPVAQSSTREIYRDLLGLAGIAATSYGAWLHYPPAGFMVGGGLLVFLVTVSIWRS